jgi:ribosomal protein L7/L12
MAIPSDKLKAIHEALFQKRKIDAIKIYRQETRAGLAEAKSVIDDLDAELRLMSPEKFAKKPQAESAGCQGVLIMLAGIIVLALIWWLVGR